MTPNREAITAVYAEHIWRRSGCRPGRDEENWTTAEAVAELLVRFCRQLVACESRGVHLRQLGRTPESVAAALVALACGAMVRENERESEVVW